MTALLKGSTQLCVSLYSHISVLSFVEGWSCQVVSGSISGITRAVYVILVHVQSADTSAFHLVQFQGTHKRENYAFLLRRCQPKAAPSEFSRNTDNRRFSPSTESTLQRRLHVAITLV